MPSDNDEPAGSSSALRPRSTITSRLHPATDVGFVTASDSAPDVPTPDEITAGGSDSELYITDKGTGSESSKPGPPRAESPNKTPEEKQCRICLAGPEEGPELGRLISPCHCRGSIRYVHVTCLKQWRVMSQSSSAFWSCPQCGFRYAFARTRALGLATSPVILSTASVALFTLIVLLASFLATWFVPDINNLQEPVVDERVRDSNSFISIGGFVVSPLGYYTHSWDTARDLFKMAVRTFGDFNPDDRFWEKDEEDDNRPGDDILDDTRIERVRSSVDGFKSTVKVQKSNMPRHKRPKRKARTPPSRFTRIVYGFVYRFTTGLGVVGILSFLNLLFSFGLGGPLRLFGGGWNRGQRRGAAGDTANLVIILFVIIGIIRTIWLVYKLTRHIAQLLLRRAETAILEVDEAGEDPEPWSVWIRRVIRELPTSVRVVPYRLLPGMFIVWVTMVLVEGWHFVHNWTRDAVGQMMQVAPQPPAIPQRGVFVGDW